MERTISTKLAIKGESQYKQAIASCNSELSTLKSALSLVESEFRGNANSMEALTAKGDALDSMYKKQQDKVSTLEAALRNAQRAQEEYASRVSTAQSNIEKCEKALEDLKKTSGDTSAEQETLTKELDKWNAELDEAQGGQAAAERGIQNWQKQLNQAKVDLNGLSDEIDKNNGYLDEAGKSADGCADSIDKFGDKAGESKKGIEELAAALAAAGIAKAAKELTDALLECVDTFSTFESQMATVKAISGASGDELTALAEKAKYMGATTAFTATQAAQAFEYMAMAGWKTDDMLGGLEGIMHLAAASGEDLASTSDIVTDALTAFGLSASDSSHFADVLASASSNANTNVGMMGETFKYAAPVAGALGYTVEDTAVAIGLMANAGIKGSQAGTALRGTLTNLAKPSETVASYMEELNISLTDSMGNTRSLSELMEILRNRFSTLTEAQKAEYAAGIAGKEAMSGLLAIVNASDADFRKLTEAISDCNGAAYNMSQIQLDNFAGKVTLLESAADGLKMAIGEQLTPALGRLTEMGTDAFTWATDFVNENPWIVSAITGVTVAITALSVGVAALAAGPQIIAALKVAFDLLAANPIVAVTAAVAGLTAAVGIWAAASEDAREGTKALTEAMQETKAAYKELSEAMAEQQESTAATLSALENLLAVEEKSAAQKESIKQLVAELNEAIPDLGLAYDDTADAINMTTDALEGMIQKSAEQEEMEAQITRLTELRKEESQITQELEEAQAAYNEAMANAQWDSFGGAMNDAAQEANTLYANIHDLTIAQRECAEEITELEDATKECADKQAEYAEQQKNTEQKVKEATNTIDGLVSELNKLGEEYEKSYYSAMESIDSQLGLFNELDGTAKTSIGNLIETLQGQVAYMESYAGNIQKAMELGVDEGLVRKLSDGSEESAQILASIVEGGTEDIAALNEQFAKVEEGKEKFSGTVAEMETDFSNKMESIAKDLNDTIQDMDLSDDAYVIGENNIQGLIDGTASKKMELINKYAEMGRAAAEAYRREVEQASPSKKFKKMGRFDIQGIIEGAKEEQKNLTETYAGAGRAALSAMEKNLPSRVEEPIAPEILSKQTATIVAAVRNRCGGDPGGIAIHVDKLEVRNDQDIERIAQELYYLAERESRSRGGSL